jgi:hypothetical protein
MTSPAASRQIILDYTSPDGKTVTAVRSTLLQSSVQVLKDNGLFERYLKHLSPKYRDEILLTLAPVWHPMDVAVAHYDAWEALDFTTQELEAISANVSNRIMGTFVATLVRQSRSVGGSPWFPLGQYDKLWKRLFVGGTIRITERGPKDALVESRGLAMFGARCFPISYQGVVSTAVRLFAKTVYVRTLPPPSSDSHVAAYSWV